MTLLTIFCALSAMCLPQDTAGSVRSAEAAKSEVPEVEIREVQRPESTGKLTAVNNGRVHVSVEASERSIAFEELLEVRFAERTVQSPPGSIRLDLIDGSRIACDKITSDGQSIQAAFGPHNIEISAKQVFTIQLQELNEEQGETWNSMTESVISSDLLLLLQASGQLTKVEGLVRGIVGESVQFDFGGSEISVPFAKIAGLRFFSPTGVELQSLIAVVRDQHGNRWRAASLNADSERLSLTLQCGLDIELPLRETESIDFSTGSVQYVAQLEPIRRTADPPFSLPINGQEQLFGARVMNSVQSPGATAGPGLEFLGAGEATYRVPEGFSRFVGRVELSPKGTLFTPCRVQVFVDGDLAWEQLLRETGRAVDFQVPVRGDSRLGLVVTANSPLPSGNVVVWREARLLK